ncbi:ExeA family protein [Moritella viscosa]|uniref:General secretion pathway protein a n=1 Tax=Moritella viscosa TaxID=80854 RepID=A0A1K9YKN3_9GAMM|nr:ExeA family protein [Moritella viscosa]SGY82286.1 General secretion pathway protein a [Moritella viscosa]SGY82768.1 General secretion pathway protein a [Moritella viscosa]SGY82921.1 General secretion pathway protein a [Moritella viscosa]SHN96658.1 General secretion pathway protein a [Moritella viscosa]SHN96687.1 General secretion pathway protein a [Moritella viscosa]
MYTEFFHLKEMPFSIAPDPRFFFMSDRHKEALTHLTYGLQGAGGFVMLTGEVGTGKTTVSRALAEGLTNDTILGYIHNPAISELELLATLCDQFKLDYDNNGLSLKVLFDLLHHYLLSNCQQHKSCVVMIDEAQLLSTKALEQLRLLTNLDVDHKKLLHIVLIGQPELQQKLKQPELRQLAQRITARYHLLPLTESELTSYVAYRLSIASGNPGLFNTKVLKCIYQHTLGIPRLVNLVCDKALYYAFKENANKITPQHVQEAVNAVVVTGTIKSKSSKVSLFAGALGMVLIGFGLAGFQLGLFDRLIDKASTAEVAVVNDTPDKIEVNKLVIDEVPPVMSEVISDKALLANINSARQSSAATQFLYKEWGYDIALNDATCRNAQYAKLRCLQRQGNYAQLVQYNLPAVVRLLDNLGEDYYATLLSITSLGVELQLNNSHLLVSQAWFEKYWSGDFTLFWTAPSRFKNSLKQNDKGTLIRWLDRNVSAALGEEALSGTRFDAILMKKVIRFQQQAGLTADGIVGPQTMMTVVHYADSTVPKLNVATHILEKK